MPFLTWQSSNKTTTPWFVSEQKIAFQTIIQSLYLQEAESRAAFLCDVESASTVEMSDLSWAVIEAAFCDKVHGGRTIYFIDKDLPLCQNINAFALGMFILMDELDHTNTERIHGRMHGIAWNFSHDCDYVCQGKRNSPATNN
eukprot:3405805-Heterocapsa_arctica.AAC.1